MDIYFGSKKIGKVTGGTWRPFEEKFIVGTVIIDDRREYEKPSEPIEVTLVEERNGVKGTIKFQNFEINQETVAIGEDQIALTFSASSMKDWSPLGM